MPTRPAPVPRRVVPTPRPLPVPAPRAARPAPEGLITCIAAVTGVQDEVGDVIEPNAFGATLAKRNPKAVFHHDFRDFVGRVLHAEELLPGDPRLPKKQPNGSPWPAKAGALLTTIQCNMATERGREVWEWTRFFAESGEAQFSIGYRVPDHLKVMRGEVRHIYGLELYEISVVLHGAHPLTMALEVKSAEPEHLEHKDARLGGIAGMVERKDAAAAVLEAKALPLTDGPATLKAAGLAVVAADTGRVLMLQRSLEEGDPAAGTWEFPGGKIDDGEKPRDAAWREWSEETGAQTPTGEVTAMWTSPNGVYRGYVLRVPTEADVVINAPHGDRKVLNPDDPDGDAIEVCAWMTPHHLPSLPSLRAEARITPWQLLAPLESKSAASAVWEAKGLLPMESKSTPFDESKHKRGGKGSPNGGQFVAKGDSDANKGTGKVSGAQSALIKGGLLGRADGHHGKGDDGLYGAKTEAAVKKWQTANGFAATGKLSGDQYKKLTGSELGGTRRGKGRARKPQDISKVHRAGITVTAEYDNTGAPARPAAKPAAKPTARTAAKAVAKKPAPKPATPVSPRVAERNAAIRRAQHASGGARTKLEAKTVPTDRQEKAMTTSYEERATELRSALSTLLAPEGKGHVAVLATYDDQVIAKVYGVEGKSAAYAVPYRAEDLRAIALGEPSALDLHLVDAAGAAVPEAVEPVVGVPAMLADATAMLRALPLEGKSLGSVRSLTPALVDFLDALSEKGLDVPGAIFGYDEEPEDDEPEDDGHRPADAAAEAPAEDLEDSLEEKGDLHSGSAGTFERPALTADDEDDEPGAGEETAIVEGASLDPEEFKALLASLRD